MNAFIILAAAESESQVAQIARTFGVDGPHLVAQIISFSIVCVVLLKFAYKPILKMLEQRREEIALGKANADKIKAELETTEAQRKEVLQKASVEAAKFIKEAKAAALRLEQEETKKAIASAEQIVAKAREAAAQEREQMLADAKREVGKLVVEATTVVTGKILTEEDQKRLAEETAKQLAA